MKIRTNAPTRVISLTSFGKRQEPHNADGNSPHARGHHAFSKKLDNLKAACALHFAYYNLCRIHKSLRFTHAMAAGITDHTLTIRELLSV